VAWHEEAARSLVETFDGSFGTPGVVVAAACVDDAGTGTGLSPGDAPGDGRFEIGSVSKTMLALLSADGTPRLDDEISRWLSAGANGGITVRQLATHTSGLPRAAPNLDLRRADPANPWAGYGFERAEEGRGLGRPDAGSRPGRRGHGQMSRAGRPRRRRRSDRVRRRRGGAPDRLRPVRSDRGPENRARAGGASPAAGLSRNG